MSDKSLLLKKKLLEIIIKILISIGFLICTYLTYKIKCILVKLYKTHKHALFTFSIKKVIPLP